MTQSLVSSLDVCRGLGISPLRFKHLVEFFSGRSWLNIWPGIITIVFFSNLEPFVWRFVLIASGTEISWRAYFKFKLFLATSRFH